MALSLAYARAMAAPHSHQLEHSGLRCPACGYDLAGLPGQICPECGVAFDPIQIRHRNWRIQQRRWWLSALIMLVIVYAPFAWLLFVDNDPSYVRSWVIRAPLLPGLVPTYLLAALIQHRPFGETTSHVLMALVTLTALLGLTWLCARNSRRPLTVIVMLIALGLSIFNSWIAYQIFRA